MFNCCIHVAAYLFLFKCAHVLEPSRIFPNFSRLNSIFYIFFTLLGKVKSLFFFLFVQSQGSPNLFFSIFFFLLLSSQAAGLPFPPPVQPLHPPSACFLLLHSLPAQLFLFLLSSFFPERYEPTSLTTHLTPPYDGWAPPDIPFLWSSRPRLDPNVEVNPYSCARPFFPQGLAMGLAPPFLAPRSPSPVPRRHPLRSLGHHRLGHPAPLHPRGATPH